MNPVGVHRVTAFDWGVIESIAEFVHIDGQDVCRAQSVEWELDEWATVTVLTAEMVL